ncbi:hypothetical protein BAY11_11905 [Elizabethkingia anophelis]|nr:hypothetical protein BAY11_11905 [Elizabethkingia anophelis]
MLYLPSAVYSNVDFFSQSLGILVSKTFCLSFPETISVFTIFYVPVIDTASLLLLFSSSFLQDTSNPMAKVVSNIFFIN